MTVSRTLFVTIAAFVAIASLCQADDCSTHLNCGDCLSTSCTWCEAVSETVSPVHQTNELGIGMCAPAGSDCSEVTFGTLKNIFTWVHHGIIHVKNEEKVFPYTKEKKPSPCSAVDYPASMHKYNTCKQCISESDGTTGWCNLEVKYSGIISVDTKGGLCIPTELSKTCNDQILPAHSHSSTKATFITDATKCIPPSSNATPTTTVNDPHNDVNDVAHNDD